MTIHARRHSPRVKLDGIACIYFGKGNSGVVLDVSDKGLRFKTASPLRNDGDVRFRLSSGGSEGKGSVAWSDESRTTGGLSFGSVPVEIGDQVTAWMDQSRHAPERVRESGLRAKEIKFRSTGSADAAPASGIEDLDQVDPSFPPVAPSVVPSVVLGEAAASEPVSSEHLSLPARPVLVRESKLSMFPSAAASTGGYEFSSDADDPKARRIGVAMLVLLCAIGAAAAAAAYTYPSQTRLEMASVQGKIAQLINPARKQQVSEVEPASMGGVSPHLPAFGNLPNEPASRANEPAAPVPDASAGSGSAGVHPQVDAPSVKDAEGTPSGVLPGSAAKGGQAANDSPDEKTSGQADLRLAQTYLGDSSSPDEKAKGVRLLWVATEKGNVDAELRLADLYARGLGVPQSCVQARILLKAAAAASPGLGESKLRELDQSGCN